MLNEAGMKTRLGPRWAWDVLDMVVRETMNSTQVSEAKARHLRDAVLAINSCTPKEHRI